MQPWQSAICAVIGSGFFAIFVMLWEEAIFAAWLWLRTTAEILWARFALTVLTASPLRLVCTSIVLGCGGVAALCWGITATTEREMLSGTYPGPLVEHTVPIWNGGTGPMSPTLRTQLSTGYLLWNGDAWVLDGEALNATGVECHEITVDGRDVLACGGGWGSGR